MRFIHTADWHLGQRFLLGKERHDEHQRFLEWLVHALENHHADVLVVAGDIFDTAHPSNAALELYYRFLWEVSQGPCSHVIIVAGNHDSPAALEAPKELLKLINVHVMGHAPENPQEALIPITHNGEISGVFAAIPFLREGDVIFSLPGEAYPDRVQRLTAGITAYYTQVCEAGKKAAGTTAPLIATGHLFATGGTPSDSERLIHLGNLAQLDVSKLPSGFDYLALGHLHRPQKVAHNHRFRYSGSPIPLSFSERRDQKEVLLVEFDGKNLKSVDPLPVPCTRRLLRFEGTFEEVEKLVKNHTQSELIDWAEIFVHLPDRDPALIRHIKELGKDHPHLEILRRSIAVDDEAEHKTLPSTNLQQLKPEDIFRQCLPDEGKKEELLASFHELLEAALQETSV